MQQEIAEKLHQIEKLDKNKLPDLKEKIKKYSSNRPTPEPFPLGELEGA